MAIAILAEWTALAETGERSEPTLAIRAQTTDSLPPPRPIYLYAGSCDDLGEIQWPLNSLTSPTGEDGGSDDADRTEYSFTANIPLTIELMLAGEFAINVHQSVEHLDNAFACGNVGGVADAIGQLVIGLREQGGSDVTGIAVLSPSPANPAMTYASVFITGPGLGDAIGTAGVTPPPSSDTNPPVADTPPPSTDPPPVDDTATGDDDDDPDDEVDDDADDEVDGDDTDDGRPDDG